MAGWGCVLDLEELKEILRIVDAGEFQEFELEREGLKLRLVKSAPGSSTNHSPPNGPSLGSAPVAPALPPGPARADDTTSDAAPEEEGLTTVSSPIVGTFYSSPDPNSPPFVNVGDRISVGQVLCIVEAMKLMNEIEAEVVGEVVKIHPENGQPVQYGDPLFTVRPA